MYTKVELVNLSNRDEAQKRNVQTGSKAYYAVEYQGMDPVTRAKKAALACSDNGRCWWIYNKVYGDLVHRSGYNKHNKSNR